MSQELEVVRRDVRFIEWDIHEFSYLGNSEHEGADFAQKDLERPID